MATFADPRTQTPPQGIDINNLKGAENEQAILQSAEEGLFASRITNEGEPKTFKPLKREVRPEVIKRLSSWPEDIKKLITTYVGIDIDKMMAAPNPDAETLAALAYGQWTRPIPTYAKPPYVKPAPKIESICLSVYQDANNEWVFRYDKQEVTMDFKLDEKGEKVRNEDGSYRYSYHVDRPDMNTAYFFDGKKLDEQMCESLVLTGYGSEPVTVQWASKPEMVVLQTNPYNPRKLLYRFVNTIEESIAKNPVFRFKGIVFPLDKKVIANLSKGYGAWLEDKTSGQKIYVRFNIAQGKLTPATDLRSARRVYNNSKTELKSQSQSKSQQESESKGLKK